MKKITVERFTPKLCLKCGNESGRTLDAGPWQSRFICHECGAYHNVYHQDRMGGCGVDAVVYLYDSIDDEEELA